MLLGDDAKHAHAADVNFIQRATGGGKWVLNAGPGGLVAGRHLRDGAHVAHAVPNDAKGGVALVVAVLGVEAVGFGFSDVPLRIGRVGILASRHADGPVHVTEVDVVLKRDGLARSAAAA